MEKIILDASVVIKWFIEEDGDKKAIGYLNLIKERKIYLIVPQLLFYELGNILLSKNASIKDVICIITELNSLPIKQEDVGHPYFKKVFKNAEEMTLSFYDASYVTLMQVENCEFITADKRLYEKVREKFTHIKLL